MTAERPQAGNSFPRSIVAPTWRERFARHADRGCRVAAFVVWATLVTFFIGMSIRSGLCGGDDADFSMTAKCLAKGLGYARTAPSLSREPAVPVLFEAPISVGPSVTVPTAAAIKIAGIHDTLPGTVTILLWGTIILALLIAIGRKVSGLALLLGTTVFSLAIFLLFQRMYYVWHSLLGEGPAVAYLMAGHWLAARERTTRWSAFFAGAFLGLALQAKLLSLLVWPGAGLILLIRLIADRPGWKAAIIRAALFALGCAAPTALFEVYKLSCLGYHGYVLNWRQYIEFTQHWGMETPEPFSWAVLQKRVALLNDHFALSLSACAILAVAALYLFRMRLARPWACLFTGLLFSSGCGMVYWLFFSIGWPRYAVMALGLGCFAMCVPIFGLAKARQRVCFALLALMALTPGFDRIPAIWNVAHKYAFVPSPHRLARTNIVAAIEELQRQGPVDLVCLDKGQYYEIEYRLPGVMNFNRPLRDGQLQPENGVMPRRVVYVNRALDSAWYAGGDAAMHKNIERATGDKIKSVLFSEEMYELVETEPAAPMPIAKDKPRGAFIAASPNPVPPGDGMGATKISWDAGGVADASVMIAAPGVPDQPFAYMARGEKSADFLSAGNAYEFRLYGDKDHKRLLDRVRVVRKLQ